MNFMKKTAFTLGEILITLTVIGILSILVIPGLLKDVNNKAKMSLLKSTVSSLDSAVQNELIKNGSNMLTSTDIYNNPEKFLKVLDSSAKSDNAFANSYKTFNGGNAGSVIIPSADTYSGKVMLKSGVGIGIVNRAFDLDASAVIIDLNGNTEPNIVGVDYFILAIYWDNDFDKGIHTGDIGGYFNGGVSGSSESTMAQLQSLCKDGNGAACYRVAELSGFDPNYITANFTKE